MIIYVVGAVFVLFSVLAFPLDAGQGGDFILPETGLESVD